jgi:hypothetical protein
LDFACAGVVDGHVNLLKGLAFKSLSCLQRSASQSGTVFYPTI